MASILDQAIILRRLDYSETSQVLVLFTHGHGKVRVIAKGIKRSTKTRFAAGIDLLDMGELALASRTIRQAGLATLTEWRQIRTFAGLRERLNRLYAAQYAADVVAALTEDWDPHAKLFDSLVALLGDLSVLDQPLPALCGFVLTLLTEIGSAPILTDCVSCKRIIESDRVVHFSSLEGGLLCRDCEGAVVEKRQVDSSVLRALQSTGIPDVRACKPLMDLLNYHLSHLMGRPPKLADKLTFMAANLDR